MNNWWQGEPGELRNFTSWCYVTVPQLAGEWIDAEVIVYDQPDEPDEPTIVGA